MTNSKKFLLFSISLFFLLNTIFAQITGGKVFLDKNANNLKDNAEYGIENVAVSNGRDVVLTDNNGNYTISLQENDVLFVIKPAAYKFPVNRFNLPQFFYAHKPNGSPDMKFAGVEPTGELPERINFPLLSGELLSNFQILVLSDPQPTNLQQLDYFDRDVVKELYNSHNYTFGITMGDIVGSDLSLFEPLNQIVAKIGIPWFNVIGNHDINFDASTPEMADETFTAYFGPSTYAFNYGKVHFIILNNIIYPWPGSFGNYIGGIRPEQFLFIENSLRLVPKDHLIVIMMHIHPFEVEGWGETFRHSDRQRLFELLKDFPHTLSVSGHLHTQRHHFFSANENWLQKEPHHHFNVGAASGNWWSGEIDEAGLPDAMMHDGTPNGYAAITFSGNRYVIDYFISRAEGDPKMNIYAPLVVPNEPGFRGELYVNFFNGSEKCTLQFRVNGGEWRPLRKVTEPDPIFCGIRYRWDTATELLSGVRPSNPVNSMHLWKARVPSDLPEGVHVIEVLATDMFGREFRDFRTYKIVNRN